MKIINNKFQKITVAIIFSWLIFFVLIPNLLVLAVSFLTRDGSNFMHSQLLLKTIQTCLIRFMHKLCGIHCLCRASPPLFAY